MIHQIAFMTYSDALVKKIRKDEVSITDGIFETGAYGTPSKSQNPIGLVQGGRSKGQLVSEWFFDFLKFPKNQRKIWQISALETKKWSNQQSKNTFL